MGFSEGFSDFVFSDGGKVLVESKRGQVEIFVNVKVNVNENAEGGIRKSEKTLSDLSVLGLRSAARRAK